MKAFVFLILLSGILFADAQTSQQLFKAAGTPVNPKVPIFWNRYYDAEALETLCKKIAKAHPDFVQLKIIGKSYQGRNLNCLVITNFKKGSADKKPGIFIMGNIHGNELQGSEYALYTAWYLTEFKVNKIISALLDDKVFYIIPTVNPDARDCFIHQPNSENSSRHSMYPQDLDKDGKYDEDPADDLDRDGVIAQMRIKNPKGAYRIDAKDSSRMKYIGQDSVHIFWKNGKDRLEAKHPRDGNYDWITEGGIDNDGDGKVDEDGIGVDPSDNEFDLNRNWKYDWNNTNKNEHNLGKIGKPFSFPETIAIKNFLISHPNIVIGQSLHNPGGQIYTGNYFYDDSLYRMTSDSLLFDTLGKNGERIIKGYQFTRCPPKAARHFGSEYDWMYGQRGIYSFLVELMSNYFFYNTAPEADLGNDLFEATHELLFDDNFVHWHQFNHPVLGQVEIGGAGKRFSRLTPGFLMEYEAHRNMAFTLYLARQAPRIIVKLFRDSIVDNTREITAVVSNTGMLPTHSIVDLKYNISSPDAISLETAAEVISVELIGGEMVSGNNKREIKVSNMPGNSEVVVRWRVRGDSKYTVKASSVKGGVFTISK